MIKEMIATINHALYNNEMTFECAEALLKNIATLTGKEYGILNRRVTVKIDGRLLDAWVNA